MAASDREIERRAKTADALNLAIEEAVRMGADPAAYVMHKFHVQEKEPVPVRPTAPPWRWQIPVRIQGDVAVVVGPYEGRRIAASLFRFHGREDLALEAERVRQQD